MKQKIKKIFKNKIFISVSLVFFIFCSVFTCVNVKAENTPRSLVAELINPVFHKNLTDGEIFGYNKNRKEINTKIYEGTADKEYSLYDMYGPNISFVTYYGETKINVDILDKIYSFFLEKGENFSFSIDDVKEIFDSSEFEVNNQVYDGRVDIVNNKTDTRYQAYHSSRKGNIDKISNFNLNIAKVCFAAQDFLISNKALNIYDEIYEDILGQKEDGSDKEFITGIKNSFNVLKYLLMISAAIMLAFMTAKYIRGGQNLKDVILKAVSFVISFAIIYIFVFNPTLLHPIYKTINNGINDIYSESTLSISRDNEIVNNSEDQLSATIWYISIFNPWCKGTFGKGYKNLYTYYDTSKEDKYKMDMSHDDILNPWDDGSKRASAQQTCGDVVVNNGRKDIRNWAALAYSCQSIYHIDAVKEDNSEAPNVAADEWPKAETTVNNSQIYVDDFRIIDAMLNISYEYTNVEESTGRMPVGSKALKSYKCSGYVPQSFVALYNSTLLLIPLTYISIMILIQIIKITWSFILILWDNIKNFFNTDPYLDNLDSFKKIINFIMNWLVYALLKILLVYLYTKLYDNLIKNVIYFLFFFIIVIEGPKLSSSGLEIKNLAQRLYINANQGFNSNIKPKINNTKQSMKQKGKEIFFNIR